ncbi:RNA polymerase sigma factor [Allomuricauda sp. SCSIO 65647]|uniref:RNA polymerase sigma factor n=1 Tax=Allomuricauda sp. SCSIO 65647 TaxID=2908843 RepID=UPI001F3EDFE1|nr:sigma-70 family RNA polymerase sigma factor [Muricauda sp. SCSIO 65647]UJH67948.1 sigma-70 family RNA polymerase sigma factor [Muricauda sp. SCSIO 65647]
MGNPKKILDSLLVISYRSGDKKALELLVKRWNKRLYRQAFQYTNDWEQAKDITQDTWRTIMAKMATLRDSNSFGSWALTIVSRKALDSIKRGNRYRKEVAPGFWERQSDENEHDEVKEQQIQKILKILPELTVDQRIVLRLFYLEEYSLKEISEVTNVSVNTVKTRLFRAREKIKTILKTRKDEEKD